ncbi:MAG: RNA polymerase sigma factor [Bryobacterales bacterium]|nr:RNA polymerase sigma factor [Bryobacterales bacterium]
MNPIAMPCYGTVPVAVSERSRSDTASAAVEDHSDDSIEIHMRRMFRLIYRIVGNVPDAQDLTQEALVKALTRKGQLKDDRKATQWLNRIAVNTALDFVRKRGRTAFEEIGDMPAIKDESPEQRVLRGEVRSWLDEGLKLLSERERTALVLRDVEDLPASEVALAMGCSTATVRSHIANARVKFRKYKEGRPS